MNSRNRDAEFGRRTYGEAPAPGAIDHDYGRRVETDRSWTVYHVFTGAPARIDGVRTTGLSRSDATTTILSPTRRNVLHRQERNALARSSSTPAELVSQP